MFWFCTFKMPGWFETDPGWLDARKRADGDRFGWSKNPDEGRCSDVVGSCWVMREIAPSFLASCWFDAGNSAECGTFHNNQPVFVSNRAECGISTYLSDLVMI